jgi:serine protease
MASNPNSTGHLRRLLTASAAGGHEGAGLEALEAAGTPPPSADVLARVDKAMKAIPPDEMGDPGEFRRALETLYRVVEPTIDKLHADPNAPLSPHETLGLEAVIKTDGSRPTLLLRNGLPPENHPLAGNWADQLVAQRQTIRTAAGAIGRIEPDRPSGRNFFGTGWLVDVGKGLVLTNVHVVEAFMRRASTLAKGGNGSIRVFDGVYIDFVAETQSEAQNRYKVVEALPSGIEGDGFQRLDVAALKIEPMEGSQKIDQAIKVVADLDGAQGANNSICVIGYPGEPERTSGVVDGVDWGWVNATLFGRRYGLKRIAPGVVQNRLGFHPQDTQRWIFGHDATTLGGSSGSPIIAWLDGGGSFGIHFAGTSIETNFAHAAVKCVAALKKLGVPVVEP